MFKSSVKTLPNLRSSYVPESPAQVKFGACRNWVRAHTVKCICIHKAVQLKTKFQHTEPDRPQHDRPAACVIAQQYSFVTSVLLRCRSQRKNSTCIKDMLCQFFKLLSSEVE
jgi:hypothetical protein